MPGSSALLSVLEHETGASLVALLLVLARVMPVCALAPWLFLRGAPPMLRAGVALVFALAFAPLAALAQPELPLLPALVLESVRGALFALATMLPWVAFDVLLRAADHLRGQGGDAPGALGLERTSLLGNAGGLLLGALFVASGGMRLAFETLAGSLSRVPLGMVISAGGARPLLLGVVRELSTALVVGVRLATPMLVLAWFVELSLALMSRVGGSLSLHFAAMPMRVLAALSALVVGLSLAWPSARALFSHALELARAWMAA